MARFADYGVDHSHYRAPSMHKPLLFTLALSGVTCFSVHAQANDDQRAHMLQELHARFAKADTDGDGALTREEAKAMPRVASHFDAIDANHDGKVTMEEIGHYLAAQGGH